MATNLHRVRQNFIYWIESINPTNDTIARRFQVVDRLQLDPKGNSTGRARDFTVLRRRSERDTEPTDKSLREAFHDYEVMVSYPTTIGQEADLHAIIEQDRHDILEEMRDTAHFVGYDGAPSTYIGLINRYETFDQLDDGENVWVLQYEFRCLIRELA